MDKSVEIILCIVAAVALCAVIVWVTRLRTRGVTRILVNSLAGGVLIAGLSAFNILVLPFNAFTSVMVGVFGVPGAAVVIAASLLL